MTTENTDPGATGADAPPPDAPPTGDAAVDCPETREKIASVGKRIAELKAEREAINADVQAELESLVSSGIPKAAMKRAISDIALDENQLPALDVAYRLCRVVLGKPIQADLFAGGDGTRH